MYKLLLAAIIVGLTSIATAEETYDWNSERYNFRWLHVPVVCGTTPEIQKYLDDNEFVLNSMSVGREGANKSGDIAYLVTYYLNKDRTESISAITAIPPHSTTALTKSWPIKPAPPVITTTFSDNIYFLPLYINSILN